MICLRAMTESVFEEFKIISQREYSENLSSVENINIQLGLKSASDQFDKLVPKGLLTSDQFFFEVIEKESKNPVGFLWLGIQNRLGRTVTSINDIIIKSPYRGNGFGKALMKCVEEEAKKAGSKRIRLHVFQQNEIARNLYMSMGFQITNLDMVKLI